MDTSGSTVVDDCSNGYGEVCSNATNISSGVVILVSSKYSVELSVPVVKSSSMDAEKLFFTRIHDRTTFEETSL